MQTVSLTDWKFKRKFDLTGPSGFDDLTGEQLVQVIRIKRSVADDFLQALDLVKLFYRIDQDRIDRLLILQKLQLGTTVEFVFDEVVKMDNWLFDRLPGTQLHGPADGLDNITFEELMHADQRLDQYKKTGDDQYLNELVAVLMRPRKLLWFVKSADIRQPFSDTSLKARAKWIGNNVDELTRQAVRFNYVACRSRMTDFFKDLFPDPDETKTNKPATNDNWLDVAIDLARKEPVLGNLHNIEKDNAYLVLKVLDRVIRQYNESKPKTGGN